MLRLSIVLLALFQFSLADVNVSQSVSDQETFTKEDFMKMCTTADRSKPEWKALVDLKYTLFMHCYNMKCRYPDWTFRTEEKECEEIYEYEISSPVMEFHNGEIYDLSIMRFFPQIDYLEFQNNNVTSLDFVKYLPRLRELHARRNPIQSIDPLKGKDLVVLEVGSNGAEFNLSVLSDMKNLEILTLGGEYHDLSPLANLKKLRKLNIGWNAYDDICVIRNLTKLEKLVLNHSNVKDILCLDTLIELIELNLMNNQIDAIDAIGALPNLETLVLNDNKIQSLDGIEKFPNLEALFIEGNPITDLSPLTKLKKFRFVFADTDKLKSCSPKNSEEIEAGKSCDNFWLIRFIDWIRF